MSNQPFGLAPKASGCKHGDFNFRELGEGMALRYCGNCGNTFVLLQNGDGGFLLVEVPEYGPEKWAEVSVHEDENASVTDDSDLIADEVADALLKGIDAAEAKESDDAGSPDLAEDVPVLSPDETE